MLPVGSEPVIRFAVQEALEANCDPVVVVRSPADSQLQDYVNEVYPQRVKLTVQPNPDGLADALLQGYEFINNPRRCAAIVPDNVVLKGTGIQSLLQYSVEEPVLGTISVSKEEAQFFGNSGAYEAESLRTSNSIERIRTLQPKGEGSFRQRIEDWPVRRCVPRLLLTPEFFERTEERAPDPETGEIDDVPILRAMIKYSTVYAAPLNGTVYDMGTPRRYTRLNCAVHSGNYVNRGN